jgi:aryl carrier-like protein
MNTPVHEHEIAHWLQSQFTDWLGVNGPAMEMDVELTCYGLDSLHAPVFAERIQSALHVPVPTYVLWEHPTLAALAAYISTASSKQESL